MARFITFSYAAFLLAPLLGVALLGGRAHAVANVGGGMGALASSHHDDSAYGADYSADAALYDDHGPVVRRTSAPDSDAGSPFASPFRREYAVPAPDQPRPSPGELARDRLFTASEGRSTGEGGGDHELAARMAAWRRSGTISFLDEAEWPEAEFWDEVVFEDDVGEGRTIADVEYMTGVFEEPVFDEPVAEAYRDEGDAYVEWVSEADDSEADDIEDEPAAEPMAPTGKSGPVQTAKRWFAGRNAAGPEPKARDERDAPENAGKGRGRGTRSGTPDAGKPRGGGGAAAGDEADKEPSLFDELISGMLSVSPDEFSKPDIQEVPFSLRQVAASVLKENRSIKVASFRPVQARADIMSAKSVYDPEAFASWSKSYTEAPAAMIISGIPSRNREFHNVVGRTGVRQHLPSGGQVSAYREWNHGTERNPGSAIDKGDGGAYVLEVTQPILNGFADMENRTLIEISRIQADITQEEFRQKVIETMSEALEAYWNVAMAREDLRINMESFELAQRLLERELGRKNEGISTQLDVDRAREAVSTRAFNVQVSREQELQAQENLKFLMNDKSVPIGMDVYIDTIENIETPLVKAELQKAIDVALANRPEMLNVDLSLKTSGARQRYAKHTLLPELNLVGSVRRNDKNVSTPTSGSDTQNTGTDWSLGVEFAMPIGNMKARANMRKAEAEVAQLEEEKRNVRDVIITEVRTVVKNLELVVREIPLNKRALEAAEKVLDGEWAKLELNQTGNRDLLSAQDLVAVTERNYVNSLIRYNIYIIRLFAAQGVLLGKMGIQLQ